MNPPAEVMSLLALTMMLLSSWAHAEAPVWTPSSTGTGYAMTRGTMLIPQEDLVCSCLELGFAWGIESKPGWHGEWTTEVPPVPEDAKLSMYVTDDFTAATARYHFVQVLADGEVIWEQDVAGGVHTPVEMQTPLPAGATTLTLRLFNKKRVTNFGVRVRMAGIEITSPGATLTLFAKDRAVPQYKPLPPDKPVPALPFTEGWSRMASIVQPWGPTQTTAVLDAKQWAPKFAKEFGFNAIIMLPTDAHNAITVPRGRTGISDEQFRDAAAAYREAGIRLILYTSIMHCGHSPQWQFGDLGKTHPEWSQADPRGAPVTMYGQPWLCPSTGALEHTIQYTEGIVRRYKADAVMLDNNQFMTSSEGLPTCYCASCQAKFRAYVLDRLGEEGVRDTLSIEPDAVRIPERQDDALWGLWLSWRKRAWAEATEQFRVRLRKINPEIVVLANTQYRYGSWILAVDDQYAHEDAILSESRTVDASGMGAKMILGRALAQGRPLWNYIGTFNEKDYTLLRKPDEVAAVTASSMAAGANPWIVFYGFTGEQNAESVEALSLYMDFWHGNEPLFVGHRRGDVAVVMSPESRDMAGRPMPPQWLPQAVARGYALVGLWPTATEDQGASASAKVTVATSSVCMREDLARDLASWVRGGGALVICPETGWRDEYGRWRDRSALSAALEAPVTRPGTHPVGAGKVVCLSSEDSVGEALANLVQPRVSAEKPVSLHMRTLPGGGRVLALCGHEPGPVQVKVRVGPGAKNVRIGQPRRPWIEAPVQDGCVSFEMSERLAAVVVK